MKKTLLYSFILASSMITFGCSQEVVSEFATVDDKRFNGIKGEVRIIIDKESGCKYIFVNNGESSDASIAMTSLLKSNGEPDCSTNSNF